jgi:hypothetical protein
VVKNDRIDHANSGHDDMVIAWLLGCWFVTHSKNLSFYGIDSTLVLSEVRNGDKEHTFEEELEISRQKEIKKEIQSLIAEIAEEKSAIQLSIMEHRLNFLTSQLNESEIDAGSFDEVMNQIKETKDRQTQMVFRRNQSDFAGVHWSQANQVRQW